MSVMQADAQTVLAGTDTSDFTTQSKIKGPLEFKGYVKELSKKLKGAIVTLSESPDGSHENLTEIFKTATPGSGEFEFKLEINKHYVLSVEKGGYTTKKVDFDTDVTLARSQYTSVPKFEFEVDMVQDLDGLAFTKAVASVFYQIKQNKFDYQLDYSKEEMQDEERELRERLEKQRLAEMAFEKKQALEEAAKLLLDKDNATAQQIIEAAVMVGDGDKATTIKGFLDVFPEVDTLRNQKAEAMYQKLQEERIRTQATGGKINFQAIFNSAQVIEDKVVADSEEKRQAQVAILREEKEEALRKEKEAMVITQKAIELQAKETLAAAIAEEELRKEKEEKELYDKVYYAIFNSNGDSQTAIANLIKTYPKSDPYKEEKAKALYSEYEKTRLTGTTLSNMDFNKLFDAADVAEQEAIKKDIEKDNSQQNSRLDAFMQKVEEKKREEEQQTIAKIEDGLKDAPKDRISQVEVFKNALPKNDPYKDVKAEVMYEQYVQQKQSLQLIEERLKTAPKDKASQFNVFFNALPKEMENKEEVAQKMYENYLATVVFQKTNDPTDQKTEETLIEQSLPKDLAGKDQVAKAIYKSGSSAPGNSLNREQQIAAIARNLPANFPNKSQVAEETYDNYVAKKQAQGGSGTVALDFASLFGAATAAEKNAQQEAKEQNAIEKRKAQELLESKREEVREFKRDLAVQAEKEVEDIHRAELSKAKDKKEQKLADAIQKGGGDRDESVEAIMKALPETSDRELDRERAEAVYDAYLKESAAIEKSGQIGKKVDFSALFAAADNAELARLEKQYQKKVAQREEELAQYEEARTAKAIEIAQAQQKEAEKDVERAEVVYQETLHKTEATRESRLAEEQKEKEQLAKQIAMEQAKREQLEAEKAAEELAMVEREREIRLKQEREEAERFAAQEAERLRKERELAAKEAADQMAMLEKQKREAEEIERKNRDAEQKEQQRLALLAAKQEEEKAKEAERLALLAQKEIEEKQKAEQKLLDDQKKEAERLALLAEKQEAEKAKEEERLALLAEKQAADKAREEERLALLAQKEEEERQKAEQKRLEDEKKEAERLALLAEKEAAAKAKEDERLAQLAQKEEEERQKAEAKRLEEEEKARVAAEIAAAKAAEEAVKLEQQRQEELALKKAEEAELARRAEYNKLVSEGDAAMAKNDFTNGWQKYKDAMAMYPDEKDLTKKFETADAELQRIEKEKAEALALQQNYDKLMLEAEQELSSNNYDAAKAKFQSASDLKPNEPQPKQKIRNINSTLEQLAAEEKARQLQEREYVLLLQEGSKALESNNLELAKDKYSQANELKPEDQVASDKLIEIAQREEQLAIAKQKELEKQEVARKKFEEEQVAKAELAAQEAARKEAETAARIAALGLVDDAKEQQKLSAAEAEKVRIEKYEKLKESLDQLDLNADEQRQAFLSELAKIYPPGLTEETVTGKNFTLQRKVINESNVVTIYEKKIWDWGGVFYFKNTDIAITEAIYKLEIGKY